MSNEIENQIVSMQFDNKQFEPGVAQSLASMDKINKAMQFPDAGKGLDGVNAAVRGFNMNPMASALQGVSKKWLALTTVAVTAIGNITNKVVDAGLKAAKSLTIDPFTQGFHEYETNLNAVQTIMANTGANVKTVNKYLNELNHYSDKTIYNFSEMAKNIGTFTAAGVPLKQATSAIKGIANLAAVSGSNSQQASTAMYQLSQALAAGRVGLQDWNSVVNAGMGGKIFQTALARTATQMGTLDKNAVKYGKHVEIMGGAFRNSLTPPPGGGPTWLTSDVLTETLNQLSGSMNKAKLAAEGYTPVQIKSILALAKNAQAAATRIKTISQLFDVVKESIGSGWAKLFQDVFGNFKEASKLWTSVGTTITTAISNIFGAVDKMLVGWRKLGGFDDLWTSIGNIFKVLGNLIHPVIVLFQAVAPSTGKAGSGLAKFTSFLAKFTGFLVKLTDPIGNFNGKLGFIGKAMKIAGDTVHAFISALAPLLPVLQKIGSGISGLFEQGITIGQNLIAGWVQGLDPKALQKAAIDLANSWVQWIKDALGIHSPATTMVPIGENIIQGIVQGLQAAATGLIGAMQKIFLGLGQAMKWAVENISYSDVLDTINSGLFLALVLMFKNFVGVFRGTMKSFQALMGNAGGVLNQFKDNLKSMQTEVRAKAIMEIAIAVGLLSASAVVLSNVPIDKLKASLAAIGGLMFSLVAAMRLMTAGGGKKTPDAKTIAKQSGQILALGAALIEFATAILILSSAVAVMGSMDPKTMQQGLIGVGAVVAGVVAATAILSKTGGGATIIATATALLILSAALTAFVGVMELYSKIDFGTIANGGGKAALVILAVGVAMRAFGKGAIGGATGMLIASVALRVIADVLERLAKIGGGDTVKSVLAIVVVLGALALATKAMNPESAASLLIMAGALFVLGKVLEGLAKVPFWDLVKAVLAIAGAIFILAITAAALSELSPLVSALGIALLLLGGAIFLAGAGVFLFASAMGILAIVGPAAFQALTDGINQLLEVLPKIGEAMGGFLVSILTGIVKAAGPLTKALGKLIGIIIDELIKLIPKGQRLFQRFINAVLDVIVHSYQHGAKVLLGFVLVLLDELDKAVPKLIRRGTNLIIAIIEGLGKAQVRIANATGKAILDFLNGMDKAVRKYAPQIRAAGFKLAVDMIDGMSGGLITYGETQLRAAAEKIASHLPGWMKKVLHISSPSKVMHDQVGKWVALGVASGIDAHASGVKKSSENMAYNALDAMRYAFNNSKKAANGLQDLTPKITPVLDLSRMADAASQISAKMGSHSVDVGTSKRKARDISAEHMARHGSGGPDGEGDVYNFNQVINSPKPVNHRQVYRGTNSQIALFKEVKRGR